MAHFAEVDSNNIVIRILVLDNAHEQGGVEYLKYDLRLGGTWIQTSYNGTIRKNFAGIGFYYDLARDAFIAPKPYPSWVLNESTCQWEAPVSRPVTGMWDWDESALLWVAGIIP